MSGANSPSAGLTRRSFLKTTAAAAGAAAMCGVAAPSLTALAEDYEAGQPEVEGETKIPCVCRCNCFGACRIYAHVRDGKVVKTSPAPFSDEHYNRMCLRGVSHVQRIYDEDRIKYPMKRVDGTERGAGQWERISWDEAISLIVDEMHKAQEYGPQAVAFWASSGSLASLNGGGGTPGMMVRMRNVLGATEIQNSVDMAQSTGQTRVLGGNLSSGLADLVNSKTIMCWGYNATEATMHSWHLIADGMDAGAKLVVIDPTYTTLASKADMWVPVRPGSDTALVLSIMQVINEEGLIDEDFLLQHTVAPYLVKETDGKFLRMSDLGVAPTETVSSTGTTTTEDPVVVWDTATGAAGSENDVAAPALEGEYEVNGFVCHTAYTLLREEFDQYPPEVATNYTEVDPDTIVELAHICAEGPVAHLLGYGSQAYGNGVAIGMVMATLPALTGNYGYPGAQSGTHWKFFPGFNYLPTMPDGHMAAATISNLALPEIIESGKFKGEDWPMKFLWVFVGNPLCCSGDTNLLLEKVWPSFDFIVTSDLDMTDTALYSDLVLPVPHYFESAEVHASGEHGFVLWAEKAIDPLYEAKSDADIARLVGEAMGYGEYFQMTDDEYMAELLNSTYCKSHGISLEALKENGCMLDGTNPSIPLEGLQFSTKSGRCEFYSESPAVRSNHGQEWDVDFERLPRFKPPIEAWPENELYSKYPLVLMSERPRFRVHSQWFNTPWLRELEPEPIVKINPEDALARGIENGMHVEAYNDRGHAVARAVVSSGIRKGTMVYPKGWQARQHKAGSWSELVSYAYDPVGVNGNFMDVLCEIRPWDGE